MPSAHTPTQESKFPHASFAQFPICRGCASRSARESSSATAWQTVCTTPWERP